MSGETHTALISPQVRQTQHWHIRHARHSIVIMTGKINTAITSCKTGTVLICQMRQTQYWHVRWGKLKSHVTDTLWTLCCVRQTHHRCHITIRCYRHRTDITQIVFITYDKMCAAQILCICLCNVNFIEIILCFRFIWISEPEKEEKAWPLQLWSPKETCTSVWYPLLWSYFQCHPFFCLLYFST